VTFQHLVNEIFDDSFIVSVQVCLDDILIYSDNIENHWKHIKEVFQQLQAHRLYACEDKCEFHKTELEFLGFILTQNSHKMSSDKLKVILE